MVDDHGCHVESLLRFELFFVARAPILSLANGLVASSILDIAGVDARRNGGGVRVVAPECRVAIIEAGLGMVSKEK